MGVYQPHASSTESVKAEINKLEDNSQKGEAPLKQSLTQEVTNKKISNSGEFKVPGAHKGCKN